MEVASQCQVPDSVKVVRHAAMQLTHLSRDIQSFLKKSHNNHEHSQTTPTAVAILTHIWFPQSQPAYRTVRVMTGML